MATRTITGVVKRPNGAPWKGGEVRFALVDDTFTVSPDETFPTDVIVAATDDAGAFSVTLVSGLDKEYAVTLPDRETFRIVVPAGGATTLEVLRAAYVGIPSPSGTPLIGPTGPSFLSIYEGGVLVDPNPTKLNFDASDFNLVESPEDEIAVALAYGSGAGTPAEGNHTHAAGNFDSLSDVVIASAVAGQGVFYDGSNWANRFLPGSVGIFQSADYTGTNVSTAQKAFSTASAPNGALTVVAATTYLCTIVLHVTCSGTTSATLGLAFAGTATLTSFGLTSVGGLAATDASTSTLNANSIDAAGSDSIMGLSGATAKFEQFIIEGPIRVNGGGTLIPQLIWSPAPGAAPVTKANSYILLTPVGSNTVDSIGAVS